MLIVRGQNSSESGNCKSSKTQVPQRVKHDTEEDRKEDLCLLFGSFFGLKKNPTSIKQQFSVNIGALTSRRKQYEQFAAPPVGAVGFYKIYF